MADDLGALVAKLQADVSDLKKGLRESREDLRSFRDLAVSAGAKVKQALSFVGVAVGIYEIASALKEFAVSSAMVGARSETVAVGMEHIGKNAGLSRGTLDYYVEQLKKLGITTQEAMEAVTRFNVSGLPLTQIEALADVARNQAALVGKNTSEAFNDILTGILTQQPEILRKYLLNIGLLSTVLKSAMKMGMTAEDIDPLTRSMLVLNAALETGKRSSGAYEAMLKTVGKQLGSMPRYAQEAKAALWALFEPVMRAGVEEMTQGWKDLKSWADANQASLKRWGQEVAVWLKWLVLAIRDIGAFIAENKKLLKTLLEIYIVTKAVAFTGIIAGVTAATTGVVGLTAKLAALRAAISVPWGLVIAVTVVGIKAALDQVKTLTATHPEYVGGAEWVPSEEFKAGGIEAGRKEKYKPATAGTPSPFGGFVGQKPEKSLAEIKAEANAAYKKAQEEAAKQGGDKAKTGGKGGGAKESIDSLLGPMLAMYKAKREAELQDAQNSLELLKSTNDKKRAELEKDLSEGLIDGQTYYRRLQELQQTETAASLAMIEKKKVAQTKAYQESLTEIEADPKMSAEAKDIARQKMAAENQKTLSKLALEGAQAKLDGEVKVTQELRRQVDITKQYADTAAGLDIETNRLLGAISEQEAILQQLNLEWRINKEAALNAGLAPDAPYFAAGAANLEAKKGDALYGNYASQITQGVSSLADAITSGGRDLMQTANGVFKNLFNEALKPGLEQLTNMLKNGFQRLFKDAGAGLAGAVMGALALVGMAITQKSNASFSSSGVQSAVTGHEAVRGIIAGESSLPIAQIGVSLADALIPTNGILSQIESNTRGGAGGGLGVTVNAEGLQQRVKESIQGIMEEYFRDVYMESGSARP